MLAVTHAVTSVAIGTQVESAPFAFLLALLFHCFADTLLHWNIYLDVHRWPYAWAALDVLAGVLLGFTLAPQEFLTAPVLAALAGGNLPDVWHGALSWYRKRHGPRRAPRLVYQGVPVSATFRLWQLASGFQEAFYRFHQRLQNETPSPVKGLAWQVVLLVGAVLLVL